MTDTVEAAIRDMAATTGHSRADIEAAAAWLQRDIDGAWGEPWPDEQIAKALPALGDLATTGGDTVANVAYSVRAAVAAHAVHT